MKRQYTATFEEKKELYSRELSRPLEEETELTGKVREALSTLGFKTEKKV